jgi:hypothetical protein
MTAVVRTHDSLHAVNTLAEYGGNGCDWYLEGRNEYVVGVLTTRIDDMDKNCVNKLLQKINITVDNKIGKMKQSIDKDINDVEKDVAKMERTCTDAIKYAVLVLTTYS